MTPAASNATRLRTRIATWLCAVLFGTVTPGFGATPYKIVTASERGTYIQIGRDLAKFVAPDAGIDLEVLPSVGSSENVQRLRYEPNVRLAMVQSDVYQAFLDQAAGGLAEAGAMIKPLRVVMPLYNEEIYFIARGDSPLNFVHDIRGARINVGPLRSGTAMSATTLYRTLFGVPIPDSQTSFLSNEDALVKLVSDKTLDVVVVVAGQPAKLLADMKPEARRLIKLLRFDSKHASSAEALKTYFPATVRAASYPSLLAEDVPSLAVKAFLVTYDYKLASSTQRLSAFARSLCRNFGKLQAEGHPKWREVQLSLPELGRGWSYYAPTERELRSCIATPPAPACTQEVRILGLCNEAARQAGPAAAVSTRPAGNAAAASTRSAGTAATASTRPAGTTASASPRPAGTAATASPRSAGTAAAASPPPAAPAPAVSTPAAAAPAASGESLDEPPSVDKP